MKINIIIEVDDKEKEYSFSPTGERESPPESNITIQIKEKSEEQKIVDEINKNI